MGPEVVADASMKVAPSLLEPTGEVCKPLVGTLAAQSNAILCFVHFMSFPGGCSLTKGPANLENGVRPYSGLPINPDRGATSCLQRHPRHF